MRWIYLAVIALFALAVVVFALQNLEVVTMSLLRGSYKRARRIGDAS